jgi:Retroviral aspartyl protease
MRIPLTICSTKNPKTTEAAALIDSGAEGEFIDEEFVLKNDIRTHKLDKPIPVRNVDGTLNKNGRITRYCKLYFLIRNIPMKARFLVTSLGGEDAILGMGWLKKENPDIDWINQEICLRERSV